MFTRKGYFPPKIDIQTRISGVQLKTQNFTLISNPLKANIFAQRKFFLKVS